MSVVPYGTEVVTVIAFPVESKTIFLYCKVPAPEIAAVEFVQLIVEFVRFTVVPEPIDNVVADVELI